ncbi:helix-turn-helix domain-containing protein [Salinicola sp. CR57]|uniref:MarR family transcriptional regulator n=1 Tax=Salinicola sp. CR57 TaxID=1949086 RepID=UPI000DA238CA|nr:helix-turn-helix domain-containing protein [Salinicola sp. CR57]
MPEPLDPKALQRRLATLQSEHPELDPLAALVLLAIRHSGAAGDSGVSTALVSRRLGLEHALVRRAAAELESDGWVTATPVGGASPALRLILATSC